MATTQELVEARKAALDRGDKALGREIYHQLQAMGVSPADVDADTVKVEQSESDKDAKAEARSKRGTDKPETTAAPKPEKE
jgi:hypothetical protein